MNEQICKRLLVLLAVIMSLDGLGLAAVGLATADNAGPTKTLDRELEPVITTGGSVSALMGLSVDQLFVYAYTGGVWRQIPAQVDQVTISGTYSSIANGSLDDNDEIVFMAKDLGDRAPADKPITATLPASPSFYEIEVTDPLSLTRKGWAYLVHSSVLTSALVTDYIDFNTGLHRINAVSYGLGLGVTHPGVDYLALGGSRVEILDRTKIRVFCRVPIVCPLTEDSLAPLSDDLVKDGTVRVILRGGRVVAYGSMIQGASTYSIPEFLEGNIRFSTDFNEAATGAMYYNAVVPEGITVDGIGDDVPAEPVSSWWQLTTGTGSLIQTADTTSIGGRQFNYYVDDSAWDGVDTGDRRHYGDTGIAIANPNRVITYTFAFYALPGLQPNVGAQYEAFFRHPLTVTAILHGKPRPEKIYLPLVLNSPANGRALSP